MIKTKDIKLRPAIGKWYEYRQAKKYNTSFVFKNIEPQAVNDILNLHYQFGTRLTELFKEKLSLAVEFYEVIIQQEKYSEFIDEHKGFQATYAIPSAIVSEFQFIIDYALAQGVINRVTGGPGLYVATDQKLSTLEEIILNTLFEDVLKSYQSTWLNVNPFNLQNLQVYSPQLKNNERIKRADEVVSLTLMFSFGEQLPAALTILFSSQDFEKMVELFNEEIQKKPKKLTVQLMPQSVSDVIVPVDVKLGTTTVAISDIIDLTPGDVFQLNERVNDNILLKIGPNAEFYGKLGRVGSRAAVQIVDLKSKYYRFDTPQEPVVEAQPVPQMEATQELPAEIEENELSAELEKEFNAQDNAAVVQSAQAAEKTDHLLKEFENEKNESDDFVWDIDDL